MSATKTMKTALQTTTALIGVAMLLTQGSTPAAAVDYSITTPNNNGGGGGLALSTGDSLTVTSTGSIIGTTTGMLADASVYITTGQAVSSIDNAGQIGVFDSDNDTGIVMYSSASILGDLDNSGSIFGGT